MPDGTPVTFDAGGVLFIQRYVYKVFGLAFALTKVLVEDGDHIRIGQIYSEHLAQSMIETKETLCANIFNRAFNGAFVGGDGVALASISSGFFSGEATVTGPELPVDDEWHYYVVQYDGTGVAWVYRDDVQIAELGLPYFGFELDYLLGYACLGSTYYSLSGGFISGDFKVSDS